MINGDGEFSPAKSRPPNYNKAWWDLRLQYQGVAPPVARSEADFDPGAKYHIPPNVPYARYFLSFVLQFQFHRALCKAAGTPDRSTAARFTAIRQPAQNSQNARDGAEPPWPEALEALTGEKKLTPRAILDYFAPLKQWLDEQNKGHKTVVKDDCVGWPRSSLNIWISCENSGAAARLDLFPDIAEFGSVFTLVVMRQGSRFGDIGGLYTIHDYSVLRF